MKKILALVRALEKKQGKTCPGGTDAVASDTKTKKVKITPPTRSTGQGR